MVDQVPDARLHQLVTDPAVCASATERSIAAELIEARARITELQAERTQFQAAVADRDDLFLRVVQLETERDNAADWNRRGYPPPFARPRETAVADQPIPAHLPNPEHYGIPTDPDCAFCAIIDGRAPATIVAEWDETIAIVPLGPVTDGHVLVLPRAHVADATISPHITGAVMRRAAEYAEQHQAVNLITSRGRAATQTVFHLHVHIVPRREDDRLALPWTGQKRDRGNGRG